MSGGPRRERKVITVVFADLVGFTARSESLDPEDVEAFLRPYHELLRREFERYGGTVEKFIGDAVAAIFGAPLAHEDDPERAVRAALAVRDAIREQGDLEVRIGINTGEAIVRLDLPPGSGEGYATGDVMNTASRLQAAAPINGILVGAATQAATGDAIRYEHAAGVEAKGKAEPVVAWVALDARSRFGVDVRQSSLVPLVGRERERTLLIDTLDRAESDRMPQLVTLVGVPGIGKSRLVFELFEELERRPELRTWRQGRSLPYGEGVSFWALSEMVKAQAGILEGDSPDRVSDKLERAVGEVVPEAEAEWVVGWLRPLVGLESGHEIARERRDESFTAWRRLLEGLAEHRPLVLVFEDLHWADDGLLDFIEHVVDWASGVPILVLGTTRPELLERRPGWGGGKRNALTLALTPLSDDDASSLLESVVGDADIAPEARTALLERASGNPLYAQQFARLVLERGSGADVVLPASVHGLIAARLDALSRDEKALLQDAAVMGKVFWTGALGNPPVPGLLQNLQRKEFIRRERRTSVATEEEFAFCHVLVRDVAYSQIPRAERAAKHRRAAAWIGSLGRPQDHAELLAHHYTAAIELGGADADLEARARRAWTDAGDRSTALNAPSVAAEAYGRALALVADDDPERPQLLYRLARAENRATGKAMERLQDAIGALLASGDLETAAEAEALLARACWEHGDRAGWVEHVERAVRLVADLQPSRAKAVVLANQARFLYLHGESTPATGRAREAHAMAEAIGIEELQAHALNTLAMSRYELGEPDAVDDLRRSIEISERINSPDSFHGWNNLGSLLEFDGRMREAEATAEESERVAQRFGAANDVLWAAISNATWPYQHGDWDETLRRLDAHIAAIEAGRPHYLEGAARLARTVIYVGRDELDAALADATRALDHGRAGGDPQSLFPAMSVMLLVRTARAEWEQANGMADELVAARKSARSSLPFRGPAPIVDALDRLGRLGDLLAAIGGRRTTWRQAAEDVVAGDWAAASEVYASMESPPDESLARLRAAQALAAAGRRDEAQRELVPALEYFRRAGAIRYLRQAEEALGAPTPG
jgi:class 3 adenylate cyclase/tetratricopeptide (TPR) repeat protein